jgi:hypothetical protein
LRKEPVTAGLHPHAAKARVEDGALIARPNALFPLLPRQMNFAVRACQIVLAVDQSNRIVGDVPHPLAQAGHNPEMVLAGHLAETLNRRETD